MKRVNRNEKLGVICNEIYRYPSYYGIEYVDSGVPEIRGKLIQNDGTIDHRLNNFRYISIDTSCRFPKTTLKSGDIVMSVRGTIGKVAIVPESLQGANITANLMRISPNRDLVDPLYLLYYFRSDNFRGELDRFSSSTTIKTIKAPDLKRIKVFLPTVDDQKRIASILFKTELLLNKRRQTNAKLDELLQSVFFEEFGSILSPKYPTVNLGEYVDFITSGGRGWAKYYSETGSRFIRSLDVQMNKISDSQQVFVNAPDNAEAKRTKVIDGDVLLTITGSRIGRVAVVPRELNDSFISQHVAIIRLRSGINPKYLSWFLSFDQGGQIIIRKTQYGQTKPGLNFKQIKRFPILIPPLKKQNHFVLIAKSVDIQMTNQERQLTHLNNLFAALQQRAFKGEL